MPMAKFYVFNRDGWHWLTMVIGDRRYWLYPIAKIGSCIRM